MIVTAYPQISVVLTSYNHAKYLREAIDSVLSQTFQDVELIIVDDCSTDDSWEIIQSYSDPRIRAWRAPENQRTATVYEGIHMATGKYLAMHHSDDRWHESKLEKQWHWLEEHPEDIAVFTHVQTIDEDGRNASFPIMACFEQPNRSRAQWLRFFFDNGNCLCHPSVMMPTSYAKQLYTSYGMTSINDFRNWVLTCIHHQIHVIEEKLCCYRVCDNAGNDSTPTVGQIRKYNMELPFILECYEKITDANFFMEIFPEAKKFISHEKMNMEYAFAMLCLKTEWPPYHYYGINKLIRMLNCKEIREQLHDIYGFTTKNMSELAKKYDPFFIPGRDTLRRELEQRKQFESNLHALPFYRKMFYSIIGWTVYKDNIQSDLETWYKK